MNSPRLRATERWLERLGDSGAGAEGDSVLFVLDNDFGELTTVLNLVLGQECFWRARVLVPPRLFERNWDALPGRIGLWTSEREVVEAIEGLQPRVVVLASAYLFPVHGLLSVEAIGRVLEVARRQRALVVTADPFLGLISQWAGKGLEQLISVDIPKTANELLVTAKRGADALLHRELGAVERLLRPLPHLYPCPTDLAALTREVTDARNLGYFNQALLLPVELAGLSEEKPHWIFVISLVDFQTQVMFHGPVRFAAIVQRLLTQTAELGRQAVLLAPNLLGEMILPVVAKNRRIEVLSFCSFRRAMSLLLTAEHCFYWNVVSHTILMQLANGRPALLFDRGHLVRAVPALYPRVIAWYCQGWEPPYLDQEADLSLAVLAGVKASHARHRDDILARFRRAPAPVELLRLWLSQNSVPSHAVSSRAE